jgi:glycosyltransferase involved in cell wall biosynthesis
MPLTFAARSAQWSFQGSKRLFFVGNISHYPNWLAVEWLSTRLAPELEKIDHSFRIDIAGASLEGVPESWRRGNINYLGTADKATVAEAFSGADLFLAPIANDYGSKIKILECLAHGSPFVATSNALSGVPFLKLFDLPNIDLDHPQDAAALITSLACNRRHLEELTMLLRRAVAEYEIESQGAWGRLIESILVN